MGDDYDQVADRFRNARETAGEGGRQSGAAVAARGISRSGWKGISGYGRGGLGVGPRQAIDLMIEHGIKSVV